MSGGTSSDKGNDVIDSDSDEGGGGHSYVPPADRFLTAQVWWLASELVRRHPHLRISGVQDAARARLIIVHDEQDAMSLQWDLVGGCKYDANGVVKSISWKNMMAAANPHEIVKRIEVGTGLGIPKSTPATTPRALAYRVIASALATAVDDRHEWYAVPAPMQHGEDLENPACQYFGDFPSTIEARKGYEQAIGVQLLAGSRVYFFQPFWAVLRDLEAIAIVDAAGVIHTAVGATPLMPLYEKNNHRLALTTARVLGRYLP
jgi:hypothetical protein